MDVVCLRYPYDRVLMTANALTATDESPDRERSPSRVWFEVALLAVGLVIQVGLTLVASHHQPERRDSDVFGVALLALGVLVLPLRRRHPVVALTITYAATLTYWSANYGRGPVFYSMVVALAHVVMLGRRRVAITAIVAGFIGFPWLGWAIGTTEAPPLGSIIALAAWLVSLLSVMEVVRSRRERAREMARSHAEALQRKASDERMRIAQEIHDSVAHNISLINIHAGVALHLFDEQPQQARDALGTIKQSSKEALVELRSILGLLRRADEDAPRAPTPSLSQLDELVARSNAAGLDVRIDMEADIDHLPRNVDVAAYRIIQESLTNVARHADRPDAVVRVRTIDGALDVEVLDEGSGSRPPDDLPSGGNGIAGMRERATAIGGTFEAGPRPGRGFAVHARLPIGNGE
jgi:signal transduction histidine kinase